jgi:hypothetical protein
MSHHRDFRAPNLSREYHFDPRIWESPLRSLDDPDAPAPRRHDARHPVQVPILSVRDHRVNAASNEEARGRRETP